MMQKQVLGEYMFVSLFATYFIWSGGSCLLVVSFVTLSVC
jgi:hypothetical protein